MGRVLSNQGGEGRAEGRYDDDVLICRYPGKHNASHLSPNCQHLHWDHSVEGFSYEFLKKILTSAEGKYCDSLSPWAPCIRPALDCIMSTDLDREPLECCPVTSVSYQNIVDFKCPDTGIQQAVRLCQDVRNDAVHQIILLECKSSLCIRKLCKILTTYMIHHLDTVNATADRSAWGPAVSLQCSFHISCSKIYIQ